MGFEPDFLYTYQGSRSAEFQSAGVAVRAGAEKVRDHPFAKFRARTQDNTGVLRDFLDARRRAVNLLAGRPIGTQVFLEAVKDVASGTDVQLKVIDKVVFRKVSGTPPVADTRGPIGLDRVEGFVKAEFPKARFAGDCVCKPNSDHADCAAVDYFDTAENMRNMRIRLSQNADYFRLKYLILFDRIYTFDTSGNFTGDHDYSGTFHSHVHISVYGGKNGAAC